MYAPSKISKKIHATAIHLVIISVALLQFLMVVFTLIRSGDIEHGIFSLHTKVALGLFVLTLNICSAQLWYRTCKKISPIKYDDILLAESSDVSTFCNIFFPISMALGADDHLGHRGS